MDAFLSTSNIVAYVIIGLVALAMFFIGLHNFVIRRKCNHVAAGVHEDWAANAICNRCHKNLGWIKKWRESQGETE